MKYIVLFRRKRNEPIEIMNVNSEFGGYYTGVYLREKGYRVVMCEDVENIEMYRNMGEEKFLMCFKKYNEKVWEKISGIDLENGEMVELEMVEINERENKNFRRKYSNYFVEK